jgi:hypothetical protein
LKRAYTLVTDHLVLRDAVLSDLRTIFTAASLQDRWQTFERKYGE